jgi:hypothetical integral membrane protein (TIGR02206 family)
MPSNSTPDPVSWLEGFSPFGLHHLTVILACAAFTWAVLAFARRRRGTPTEHRLRAAWGGATLLTAVLVTVYWMQPERYDLGVSWPLHLCDLAAWFAPYALLTRQRWPKTLLYFWGVGLSTQGFVTPTIEDGITSAGYWLFWIQHLGVVGGGVYLAVVNRYRPGPRDLAVAVAATGAIALVMIPLNLSIGANYMYVGDSLPGRPTVIDFLGPWPGRLVWIALLGSLAFTLAWLGSELVHRLAPRHGHAPSH